MTEVLVRKNTSPNGLIAKLSVLEQRARNVKQEIKKLLDEYEDKLYVLFWDRIYFEGFKFLIEDGVRTIRSFDGEIKYRKYNGGYTLEIKGLFMAERFLEKFPEILDYAKALRDVEHEIEKLEKILRKAKELATIYDDEIILEETLREIEQYLEQPRIVG